MYPVPNGLTFLWSHFILNRSSITQMMKEAIKPTNKIWMNSKKIEIKSNSISFICFFHQNDFLLQSWYDLQNKNRILLEDYHLLLYKDYLILEEGVWFEPTEQYQCSLAFKASAISLSATLPFITLVPMDRFWLVLAWRSSDSYLRENPIR